MPNKQSQEIETLLGQLAAADNRDGWYGVLEQASREIEECRWMPDGNVVCYGFDFRVGLSHYLKPYAEAIAEINRHNVSLCPTLRMQKSDASYFELLVTCFEHCENSTPIHVSQYGRPLATNAKSIFDDDIRGLTSAGYVNAFASVRHSYWYVNPDHGTIVFDGWISCEEIDDSFGPNEVFDRYQELFEELEIGSENTVA